MLPNLAVFLAASVVPADSEADPADSDLADSAEVRAAEAEGALFSDAAVLISIIRTARSITESAILR